jgi:hypothetical protein
MNVKARESEQIKPQNKNNKNPAAIALKISGQLNRVKKTLELLEAIFPVCIPSHPIRNREDDGVHVFVVAALPETAEAALH